MNVPKGEIITVKPSPVSGEPKQVPAPRKQDLRGELEYGFQQGFGAMVHFARNVQSIKDRIQNLLAGLGGGGV